MELKEKGFELPLADKHISMSVSSNVTSCICLKHVHMPVRHTAQHLAVRSVRISLAASGWAAGPETDKYISA